MGVLWGMGPYFSYLGLWPPQEKVVGIPQHSRVLLSRKARERNKGDTWFLCPQSGSTHPTQYSREPVNSRQCQPPAAAPLKGPARVVGKSGQVLRLASTPQGRLEKMAN